MRKKAKIAIFFLFSLGGFFFYSFSTFGVVINEIAWMGTSFSSLDEWIELFNPSPFSINLKNWKFLSQDGGLEIELKGEIGPRSFFLLERTDDSTLPTIKADLIYRGSLNNKGEHLKLLNSQGEVVEEIDCSQGWFKGKNQTKQTMERKDPQKPANSPSSWQTSQKSGGTPKAKNSSGEKEKETLNSSPQKKEVFSPLERFGAKVEKTSFSLKPKVSFLIALALAVFSGLIVLILKKRFFQKENEF